MAEIGGPVDAATGAAGGAHSLRLRARSRQARRRFRLAPLHDRAVKPCTTRATSPAWSFKPGAEPGAGGSGDGLQHVDACQQHVDQPAGQRQLGLLRTHKAVLHGVRDVRQPAARSRRGPRP